MSVIHSKNCRLFFKFYANKWSPSATRSKIQNVVQKQILHKMKMIFWRW